jgi:hypothetical protein
MKYRFFALTLIFTLLLAGCTSAAPSPEAVTATPNIVPRLDPSPTPSDSTLPLTCQITDLNVYINEADGYCFAYPTRFTLGEHFSNKLAVLGPAVDESVEPIHATLTVEFAPATDKSLREQAESYLKEFSVADPASFTWTQVPVADEAGWMVEPVPVMLSWRIVFVQHNGTLFRLMYWPMDIPEAQADLSALTQTTLGSFAFTK